MFYLANRKTLCLQMQRRLTRIVRCFQKTVKIMNFRLHQILKRKRKKS